MRRPLSAVSSVTLVLLGLASCGSNPSPSDRYGAVSASTAVTQTQPVVVSEVAGPSEFFFVVDGPLVTNGPPWDCVSAGTGCGGTDGNFSGTIELIDGCIVVQGSDSPPGSMSVVIFEFGVTWDEATSTILGLGPEPIAIGEEADLLANDGGSPDAWTAELGLPDVPDKVHECMRKVGTDSVMFNTPWTQLGIEPVPTVPDVTSAPSGP